MYSQRSHWITFLCNKLAISLIQFLFFLITFSWKRKHKIMRVQPTRALHQVASKIMELPSSSSSSSSNSNSNNNSNRIQQIRSQWGPHPRPLVHRLVHDLCHQLLVSAAHTAIFINYFYIYFFCCSVFDECDIASLVRVRNTRVREELAQIFVWKFMGWGVWGKVAMREAK